MVRNYFVGLPIFHLPPTIKGSPPPTSLFYIFGPCAICGVRNLYFFLIPVLLVCIPAHDSKMEERIEDYRKITTSLDLPKIVAAKQYKSDGKQLWWIHKF